MIKGHSHIEHTFSWIRHVIWSILAVVAGASIYILFRPEEARFLHWFRAEGSGNWFVFIRENSLSLTHSLPPWFVYSLPNGLWAFAYTLIILSIWKGNKSGIRYVWFLSIPLLVFGFELLQLAGYVQGTFCGYDMIWGALGIALGSLTVYLKNYNQNLIR